MTQSARDHGIMQGFPPPPDKRPSLDNWDLPPFNRWSFQHVRELLPTAPVRRGAQVRGLPRAEQSLDELTVAGLDGVPTPLAALLRQTYTDGFLVLHRGRVVYERFFNDMSEGSLHLSQSVGKSFVSTLVGQLWGQGLLDLERPVQHYIPELARSGYRDALLWQVLDMRSGVKFNEEDYADTDAEIGKLDRSSGWKPLRAEDPASVLDLVLELKRERPHGGPFVYRSIETEVLGWLVARVAGERLVDFMGRELWAPMGAAHDADFTVDRAGTPLASGGLNAALSDYARFGQLFLEEGAAEGRQVVPAAWVAQCGRGDTAAFAANYGARFVDCPNAAYSRQWWALAPDRRRQVGLGIFGQMLWIDPVDQLVVAKLSTWPDYLNDRFRMASFRACEAIGRALNG
jgi:CubicO group peptidase (beta-lactamase class C family)